MTRWDGNYMGVVEVGDLIGIDFIWGNVGNKKSWKIKIIMGSVYVCKY